MTRIPFRISNRIHNTMQGNCSISVFISTMDTREFIQLSVQDTSLTIVREVICKGIVSITMMYSVISEEEQAFSSSLHRTEFSLETDRILLIQQNIYDVNKYGRTTKISGM